MTRTDWGPPGPAWLFCPGDRPERFERATAAGDVTVLDLEDAVAPGAKADARRNVVAALSSGEVEPSTTVVRINALETPWAADDLDALVDSPARAVMLPKATAPLVGLDGMAVVALCETAAGIQTATRIATAPGCVALAWGGQDLAVQLGTAPLGPDGRLHPSGQHARMTVRFAAAAAGIPAIDTVRTDVADDDGLEREARAAAGLGYLGKLVIHPRQVPVVREAFRPSEAEVAWAHAVEDAVAESTDGVVLVDGQMVDAPVITRARQVLARTGD